MEFKLAGALNGLALFAFIAMWYILLFSNHPECTDIFEAASETAMFVLTEPGREFFYATFLSMLLCLTCGFLLFIKKFPLIAMCIIFVHAVLGGFIYDWGLVLAIALPLTLFGKVKAGA